MMAGTSAALAPDQPQPGLPVPAAAPAPANQALPDDVGVRNFTTARATAQSPDYGSQLAQLVSAPAAAPAAGSQPGAAPVQPPAPPLSIGHRILNGIGAVAKDVGGGVMDMPRQLMGGAIDYANGLFKFADSVVKKAEAAGMPNVYMQLFDNKGKWDPSVMSADEFRTAQAAGKTDVFQFPTTGGADTVTGNIVRAGTRFMIGRGGIAKAAGGGVGGEALADFTSGATGGLSEGKRLSNVIDEHAPNFLTGWLKSNPEDEGSLTDHLKSGLEMAGMGVMVHGAIRAAVAAKDAIKGALGTGEPAGAAAAGEGGTAAAGGATEGAAADAAPGAPAHAAENTVLTPGAEAVPSENTPAKPLSGTGVADIESELPWATTPETQAAFEKSGWPKGEETGNAPLSTPAPDTETVTITPEAKANFEQFMRQQKGEEGAPLEANAKPLADQRSADFSSTGPGPVRVNLNMINGPADIRDAIARVSAQIPADAVQHNDEVLAAARAVGMSAEDFLNGPAKAMSNTEVTAMRMIYQDSAAQLLDLSKRAASSATPEDQAQALAAFSKFSAMTDYVQSAKAASGRSVQAWGIPLRAAQIPYAQAVAKIVEASGGDGQQVIEKLAQLDTPEQVASAAGQAMGMSGRDWFLYGWRNALLSNPRTVIKKMSSDGLMAVWNVASKYAAETFGSGAIPQGEAAQTAYGYYSSFKDAIRYAGNALRTGESNFFNDYQANDEGYAMRMNVLSEGTPTSLPVDEPTKAASNYLQSLLPTTWIGAADDGAKFWNYRSELRALAYRQAAGSEGLNGEELETRMAGLMDDVPQGMHKQAVAKALSNTFQDPLTGLGAQIRDIANTINLPIAHTNFEIPLGRIIMPFIQVPVNIARWSYQNSPLALAFPSSAIRAELSAGGAVRDLAVAKIALGSAVSASAIGLSLSGTMTGKGPSDPELRRAWTAAGNEPYSIGGKQIGYNQIEPMGLMFGAIADTIGTMKFAKDEDRGQLAASLAFGIGNAMLSKTYMQGMSDFFAALDSPDTEAANYSDRLFASMVTPQLSAGLRSAVDPWQRQHYDLLQTIENRLPYVSQGLPPSRTLWGDAVPLRDAWLPFLSGTGAARMLSPVPMGRPMSVEPIDTWIWDNRMAFPRGPDNKLGLTRPGIVQSFSAGPGISTQVELTPQQHDRFQVLAGNGLKDPATGMGAKDTLNALVEGKYPATFMQEQWNNAPAAMKALIVGTTVAKFRNAAKQQLIAEFPNLQASLNAAWQQRGAQLSGTPQAAPQ